MKKVILAILALIIATILMAEEQNKHGLGFAGGMISGSGFSYRYLGENHGYQINLAGISSGYDDDKFPESMTYEGIDQNDIYTEQHDGRETFLNIGINYLKPLHATIKSTFYALGGAAIYYNSNETYEQDYTFDPSQDTFLPTSDIREISDKETRVNFGVGIGIVYNLTNNISLFVDWPLVASYNGENMDLFMAIPQGGIHYFFK